MSGTERLNAIDIAKGIGILLVVIGHVPPSIYAVRFIYDFHMPLFFFLSGLFLDEKKYDFKSFIITRATSLIIPLVTFCFIAVLLQLIPSFDYRHPSMGIGGAALWFLPVLFCSECLVYCIWRFFNSSALRMVVTILLIVGAVLVSRLSVHLPSALHAVPFAAAMLSSGSLLKDSVTSLLKNAKKNIYIEIAVTSVCIILIALLAFYFKDYTNMYNGHIAFGVLGFVVAFIGIIGVLVLSNLMDNTCKPFIRKPFIYLGRNSLVIFGTHLAFKGVFERIWGSITFDHLGQYVASIFFIMGGAFLMVEMINRFAPWCIGRFTLGNKQVINKDISDFL